jgi:hypothetical protein
MLAARMTSRVDHRGEVFDVGGDVVVLVGGGSARRLLVREAADLAVAATQDRVGPVLYPLRHVHIRRPAVGRVVLEPAVLRRVVRGGDDDAIGQTRAAAVVVPQDRMRDDRGRRRAVVGLDEDLHPMRGQDRQRSALGWPRDGVGVFAHPQRAGDPRLLSILADRLRDGGDVRVGEGAIQRGAAMARRAKADELLRVGQVGLVFGVGAFELGGVDEQFSRGRATGQRGNRHRGVPPMRVGGPALRAVAGPPNEFVGLVPVVYEPRRRSAARG